MYYVKYLYGTRPHYGYKIISRLEEWPVLAAKESTIYPLLRRLLKDGFLTSYWQETTEGLPPRNTTRSPKRAANICRLCPQSGIPCAMPSPLLSPFKEAPPESPAGLFLFLCYCLRLALPQSISLLFGTVQLNQLLQMLILLLSQGLGSGKERLRLGRVGAYQGVVTDFAV